MKLKVPTCEHCGSHKYSSLSYGDKNYTMDCRICGKTSKSIFDIVEVDFPTVVFPDGDIIKGLRNELELFYNESTGFPFGVCVDLFTNDVSNYSDFSCRNVTEFHYLFDKITGEERVALESDLHGRGSTPPLNSIKFIKISKELLLKDEY